MPVIINPGDVFDDSDMKEELVRAERPDICFCLGKGWPFLSRFRQKRVFPKKILGCFI